MTSCVAFLILASLGAAVGLDDPDYEHCQTQVDTDDFGSLLQLSSNSSAVDSPIHQNFNSVTSRYCSNQGSAEKYGPLTLNECMYKCLVMGCKVIQYDCNTDCWLLDSCEKFVPSGCSSSVHTSLFSGSPGGKVKEERPSDECNGRQCGMVCSEGACSKDGKCTPATAAALECEKSDNYLLVGIKSYSVNGDWDDYWWNPSQADVSVEVLCGQQQYFSPIFHDQDEANLDMYFFVPKDAGSCTIQVQEHDDENHEVIMNRELELPTSKSVAGTLYLTTESCSLWSGCKKTVVSEVAYFVSSGQVAQQKTKELTSSGMDLTPGHVKYLED